MQTAVIDAYPTRNRTKCVSVSRPDPVVWGSAAGPLDASAVAEYDRRGFHTVDALLPAHDVGNLLDETARLGRELADDNRVVREAGSGDVRSVFDVHRLSDTVGEIIRRPEIAGIARQLLGSEVYIHQSRLNVKPGFRGGPFYWHSDFETWHAEDGMPRPRALSISVALTENYGYNGGLMIMPGSHRTFVSCAGTTPDDYYQQSLVTHVPPTGSPDEDTLTSMAAEHGIATFTGSAGSATVFDSNCMHGSNGNITPFPRSNLFVVFNSVENTLGEPFSAPKPRPDYLGSRDFTPLR
ncbi:MULTISPECIES: ectoine hydroxylase [Rhodococcus]|uniref:ectoine hydroxylase n=1 Tax=Rhodococcus TaxID=1827 RepID=UPI0007439C62|nr:MULTISPECIES: ectoine hydroxylase [Rhodococcus]MDO2376943.1 ectoine hydroxylase [Rhodococcus ruber]MDX5451731.1 ectoine hydroxylase [Rhodococcus sp. (in: high G+C Gram-positive bacteria)]AWG97940.1 ectoine hydroxylase [Rhodococcus ruber]AXY50775.1 multidrug DMT transporter permease [Rhodococcus ruber]MBD8052329.1 ectoine hydroxylase [Rhodococcus ruber]